jgi:hypothetical protein
MRDVEHGDAFLFEITNALGKVPTQGILDKIRAEVNLTKGNLRRLIEAMELTGTGTARTAHIDDAVDLSSINAAYQLKHALEDMLLEMEAPNG